MTILQTNLEVNLLTNPIKFAPSLPQYSPEQNPAPIFRTIITTILNRLDLLPAKPPSVSPSSTEILSLRPNLSPPMKTSLLAETIHAIVAIGGHDNPPARHIVGFDAVASVKEKLKTVSEELEDFVEVSCAADVDDEGEEEGEGVEGNNMVRWNVES